MSRASISTAASHFRRPFALAEHAKHRPQDASRLKASDHHDNGAVDHESKAGAGAAQQAIGYFLQRRQDYGANEGTEQKPGTAERGHDQHLNGDQNTEPGLRIDEAEHDG